MRLVLVEWIDAHADANTWSSRDELSDTPRLIRSVGYLLPPVIERHTTIAASWDRETDTYGSVMHIPDGMVKRTKRLKAR